jgi:hypothetical protein
MSRVNEDVNERTKKTVHWYLSTRMSYNHTAPGFLEATEMSKGAEAPSRQMQKFLNCIMSFVDLEFLW